MQFIAATRAPDCHKGAISIQTTLWNNALYSLPLTTAVDLNRRVVTDQLGLPDSL